LLIKVKTLLEKIDLLFTKKLIYWERKSLFLIYNKKNILLTKIC